MRTSMQTRIFAESKTVHLKHVGGYSSAVLPIAEMDVIHEDVKPDGQYGAIYAGTHELLTTYRTCVGIDEARFVRYALQLRGARSTYCIASRRWRSKGVVFPIPSLATRTLVASWHESLAISARRHQRAAQSR